MSPAPATQRAAVISIEQVKRSSTLFEIVDQLDALFNCLEGAEALAPEELISLHAEIDLMLVEQTRKVDGIAGYLRHLAKQQEFAEEEVARLKGRRDAMERRAERIRKHVMATLASTERGKIEGRNSTLVLVKCPASVDVFDESQLPAEYLRQKVTTAPAKTEIKAAMVNGVEVPGARLVTDRVRLEVR